MGIGRVAREKGWGKVVFRTPFLPEWGDAVGPCAWIGTLVGVNFTVVGFEGVSQFGLGVCRPIPVRIVQWDALLGAHANAIKTIVTDIPCAIEFG